MWVGPARNTNTPDIVYYEPSTQTFDVIRKSDGTRFNNIQEMILDFQVVDHNLVDFL